MRILVLLSSLLLVNCGGGEKEVENASPENVVPEVQSSESEAKDQGSVITSAKMSGSIYFNYDAPLEAPRAMAVDLKSKRYRVVTDGVHPSVSKGTIAYVNFCSPLEVQLAVTDPDGFMIPLSECVKRDTLTENALQGPAISPDGTKVAILNNELHGEPGDNDQYGGLGSIIGAHRYSAVQVYDLKGNILAEFKDYGPATWSAQGDLIMAGRGGDVGYGIFKANEKLTSPKRIDDGRLSSDVDVIAGNPKKDEVAFVFNGQIFTMKISSGKAKRIHQHGNLLAGLSYSPDGGKIAFISNNTLDERVEMKAAGYPIFVYDDGEVENVLLPFVVSGPLDWTK